MIKMTFFSTCFLLVACTTDSVPDEDFEGIATTNFPQLNTVPTPPHLSDINDLTDQKNLQENHAQALQKKESLMKSVKA